MLPLYSLTYLLVGLIHGHRETLAGARSCRRWVASELCAFGTDVEDVAVPPVPGLVRAVGSPSVEVVRFDTLRGGLRDFRTSLFAAVIPSACIRHSIGCAARTTTGEEQRIHTQAHP